MKKNKSSRTGMAIAGVGIAIAAAAGAYFLYGTEAGSKKRKMIKGWMLKAKGEVLEKLEKAKDVSEEKYFAIVDDVSKKYSKIKSIGEKEIDSFSQELKKHWKNIRKEIK